MKHAMAYLCGLVFCAIAVLFSGGAQGADKTESAEAGGFYTVQVMALKDNKAAHEAAEALIAKGYDAYVVTIADDSTGLPHKVRFGHFQLKADAQRSAASYEARESDASYVVHEAGISLGVPAQPAVTAVAPAQQGSAAGSSQNFLTQAVPEVSFGNLLGGRTYLEIAPAFSYRLQYEDNIDYDTSDKLSDWSNVYMPEIKVGALGPRFSLSSVARLWITEYINERDFNNVDQDYNLTLGYTPNDRLEVSGGVGYTLYNNTNRFLETGGGGGADSFENYKEESKLINGGFTYALTPRSTVGLNGFFTQYTIDDANDSNNFYGGTAEYSYQYSPRTQLILGANYFGYDFNSGGDYSYYSVDNPYYSTSGYELTNYSITGGFDHTVDQSLRFGAKAGMRFSENDSTQPTGDPVKPKKKVSGDGTGWVAAFDIEKRVGDFNFAFEASHDISINSTGGNYESTKLILTNTYNITRLLSAQLGLQYWIMKSDGDEFTGYAAGYDEDRKLYYITSSLTYKIYRWLELSLVHYYRYQDQEFDRYDPALSSFVSDSQTYNGNTVYLQLRFTPLRPWVIR